MVIAGSNPSTQAKRLPHIAQRIKAEMGWTSNYGQQTSMNA